MDDGRKISGFQAKPWLEERYEIKRGGPSGSSEMLIVVDSCLEIAELSRLGRLWCSIFCFCVGVEPGVVFPDSEVFGVGEHEYEDEDEPEGPLEDWWRRWSISIWVAGAGVVGMAIEEDMAAERE